jgi:TPR repeat protein
VHLFAPLLQRRFGCSHVLLLAFLIPHVAVASPSAHQRDSLTPEPGSVAGLGPVANSGDAIMQFRLAYSLLFDPRVQHTNPDYATGLSLLRSSALQHFAPAQFFLGYAYEHGQGVPVDYSQAAENYRASAVQGYAAAENNLCALYYHGLGVPKDLTVAFEYCRSAALHGSPVGQYHLGSFYYYGYGTARDVAKAVEWTRTAAEHGFADAQLSLAKFYSDGTGVPIDFSEAAHWAKLAAEQGLGPAAHEYAYLCENGIGVSRDYVSAYLWYSRALADGDKSAGARVKAVAHHLSREERDQAKSILAADASHPQQSVPEDGASGLPLTASPL